MRGLDQKFSAEFCSHEKSQVLAKICTKGRNLFKVPFWINSFCCSNFHNFFWLQCSISTNNSERKVFYGRRKNLVRAKGSHNKKTCQLRRLTTPPSPFPCFSLIKLTLPPQIHKRDSTKFFHENWVDNSEVRFHFISLKKMLRGFLI